MYTRLQILCVLTRKLIMKFTKSTFYKHSYNYLQSSHRKLKIHIYFVRKLSRKIENILLLYEKVANNKNALMFLYIYTKIQANRHRTERTGCGLFSKNMCMNFINTQCLAYPLLGFLSSSFIVCVLKFPTSTRLPQLLFDNFYTIACTLYYTYTYLYMCSAT